MTEPKVLLTVEGPVATLQLHHPQRHNALSRALLEELAAAAHRLAVDRRVRAVILHGGEAKLFCAGADLKERQGMTDEQVFETVHLLRETVNLYAHLPMPVIAAIHGGAFGGGCELAMAADLRLMAADGQIGLTETSLAIIPGAGGCARLAQLVGTARARELIFTARRLEAAEAQAMGLVNRVLPREELLPAARALADQIAGNGPLAVRAAKEVLNGAMSAEATLAREWEAYQALIPTRDRLEGLCAFAQKRIPEYRGE